MKRSMKLFIGFLIIFLLIGLEAKQVDDAQKGYRTSSGILSEIGDPIAELDYMDPPKKPYSLKDHVDDLKNVTTDTTDTDGDGLVDSIEWSIGTNYNDSDTDFDNLNDSFEIYNDLDPLNPDTNEDGLPDYIEITNVSLDFDGDGLMNAWDFDNDGDGVNDMYDVSPFANSSIHSKFTFNIITDGKPLNMNFQIRPGSSEHLKLYYQTWDWPFDEEGSMQDLDNSEQDLEIMAWLRITPSVLPDQEEVVDRGVIITDDFMQIAHTNPSIYLQSEITDLNI